MKHWRRNASKTLVEDRWIRLRADSCETTSGVLIDPFYVLEYAPWVSVFAVTDNTEVVFVRQYRHGLSIETLELPSGGVARSDANPVEAGLRELREETGYTSVTAIEIAKIAPNPATHTNYNHIIFAPGVRLSEIQSLDEGEDIEVELMPIQRVKEALATGTFVSAIQTAASYHGLIHLEAQT